MELFILYYSICLLIVLGYWYANSKRRESVDVVNFFFCFVLALVLPFMLGMRLHKRR